MPAVNCESTQNIQRSKNLMQHLLHSAYQPNMSSRSDQPMPVWLSCLQWAPPSSWTNACSIIPSYDGSVEIQQDPLCQQSHDSSIPLKRMSSKCRMQSDCPIVFIYNCNVSIRKNEVRSIWLQECRFCALLPSWRRQEKASRNVSRLESEVKCKTCTDSLICCDQKKWSLPSTRNHGEFYCKTKTEPNMKVRCTPCM